MTEKQQNILDAALELFAEKGYHATSTGKIAARARVSEGLIFRHFGNKEGLLNAVFAMGEERIRELYADIVFETDSKRLLRKSLDMGLTMLQNKTESKFWKLQYKIKWETEYYNARKGAPLQDAVTRALADLGYESPEAEAQLFMLIFDGLATRSFLQKDFDPNELIEFLKQKYAL